MDSDKAARMALFFSSGPAAIPSTGMQTMGSLQPSAMEFPRPAIPSTADGQIRALQLELEESKKRAAEAELECRMLNRFLGETKAERDQAIAAKYQAEATQQAQALKAFDSVEESRQKIQELQLKISALESAGGQLRLTGGSMAGSSQDAIEQVRREAAIETSRLKEENQRLLTEQDAHRQELLRLKQRHEQEVTALKAEHGKVLQIYNDKIIALGDMHAEKEEELRRGFANRM